MGTVHRKSSWTDFEVGGVRVVILMFSEYFSVKAICSHQNHFLGGLYFPNLNNILKGSVEFSR